MRKLIQILKSIFGSNKILKKVLVIDDSLVDRRLVIKALGGQYEVVTANGGISGIQQAYAQAPDLIVLDYMMPDMDGPRVCDVLKHDARTRDIPVIFLTGMDTPQAVVNGLEQGAESYLIKPVNAKDLQQEVALRISQRIAGGKEN